MCVHMCVHMRVDEKYGYTALHRACYNDHADVVNRLMQFPNVDPNVRDNQWCCTPLHEACSNGHVDVVNRLMESPNVDPNVKTTAVSVVLLHIRPSLIRHLGPREVVVVDGCDDDGIDGD
eukprot:GFYU01063625.1.p1 GENE.GFYU01063625.1~~GFYU01063625.1.p1  ORF type:complete len:120 (+),score=21.81 GFYU01063625.1:44-403(+)